MQRQRKRREEEQEEQEDQQGKAPSFRPYDSDLLFHHAEAHKKSGADVRNEK